MPEASIISLVSKEWLSAIDVGLFEKLVELCSRNRDGLGKFVARFERERAFWQTLPKGKLKAVLIKMPKLRLGVPWASWPYRDISDLIDAQPVFELELKSPRLYYAWKYWKSIVALAFVTIACAAALMHQHIVLEKEESDRIRWNSIVDQINKFDREGRYLELAQYVARQSKEDKRVLSSDIVVSGAQERLGQWQARDKRNAERIVELTRLRSGGWKEDDESRARRLFKELKEDGVVDTSGKDRFEDLKRSFDEFTVQLERKRRIQALRNQMQTCAGRSVVYKSEDELAQWTATIEEARRYGELKEDVQVSQTELGEVKKRLRKEKLQSNVDNIAKSVADLRAAISARGSYEQIFDLRVKFMAIQEYEDFSEYKKTRGEEYAEIQEAISRLEELIDDAKAVEAKVRDLKQKYNKAFLPVSAQSELASLKKSCDEGFSRARKGVVLEDVIEKFKLLGSSIDAFVAADKKCVNLLGQLNAARTYDEYRNVRRKILADFGDRKEFAALKSFGELSQADLNKSYPSSSFWLSNESYKYHFVGTLKLTPDDLGSAQLSVDRKLVNNGASLYTFLPKYASSKNGFSVKKLFSLDGSGKYYKERYVNYKDFAGAPLFVETPDYKGRKE